MADAEAKPAALKRDGASATPAEMDALLRRLDSKIAAEHAAMDRLLERIATGLAE